jgi:hypothetical protein
MNPIQKLPNSGLCDILREMKGAVASSAHTGHRRVSESKT